MKVGFATSANFYWQDVARLCHGYTRDRPWCSAPRATWGCDEVHKLWLAVGPNIMFDESLQAARDIALRLESHESAHTTALTAIDRLSVAKTLFDLGHHHSSDENELQRQAKSLNRCGL